MDKMKNTLEVLMENESRVKTVKVNGVEVRINDIHISKPKQEPAEVHLTFYADIAWQTAKRPDENAGELEKQNAGMTKEEMTNLVQYLEKELSEFRPLVK